MLDTSPFNSRRLGLIAIGILGSLQIFLFLAAEIVHQGSLLAWDQFWLTQIHAVQSISLTTLARTVTPLGVSWGVIPVSITIGVGLGYARRWQSLLYLVLTLGGTAFLNRITKAFFHRDRPQLSADMPIVSGYSFPSGHAMSSMAFVIVLVVLMWNTTYRWPVLIAGSCFVLLIAWTRLYLGVHYPSDIVGGWTLAGAWALGVRLLIKP